MYHNIGSFDRLLRIIIGIVLLIIGATMLDLGFWMFASYLIGTLVVLTGMIGWSPLYSVFNFSTRRVGLDKISREEIAAAVKEHRVSTPRPSAASKSAAEKKKTVKKTKTKKTSSKKKEGAAKSSLKTTTVKKKTSKKK